LRVELAFFAFIMHNPRRSGATPVFGTSDLFNTPRQKETSECLISR